MEMQGVDICIEALESPASTVPSHVGDIVLRALAACKEVGKELDQGGAAEDADLLIVLQDSVRQLTDDLRDHLRERPVSEEALVEWSRDTLALLSDALETAIRQVVSKPPVNGVAFDTDGLKSLSLAISSERAALSAVLERMIVRREAQALVEETRQFRDAAQSAAGMAGNAGLGKYFAQYAREEMRAANGFRVLTVVAILGGTVGVLAAGLFEFSDLQAISSRIAIAATSAALATYFARQAGQHRRLLNWARSTQVQLESFPAFIAPVPEADQSEAYRTLARRVLSAPPEKGADQEDSVGSAQLLDLLVALAKRGI